MSQFTRPVALKGLVFITLRTEYSVGLSTDEGDARGECVACGASGRTAGGEASSQCDKRPSRRLEQSVAA